MAEEFLDPTLRRKLGSPSSEIGNARGKLRVWVPHGRGIIVSHGTGYGSFEVALVFLKVVEDAMAGGAREIWDDWAHITAYDPASRVEIVNWTKAHPEIAPNIHVLVGSKLIAMGLAVANLAMGNVLDVTSDRLAFEKKILARL